MANFGCKAAKAADNVQGVLLLLAAAAAPRRAKVFEWEFGCNATPADNTFVHIVQRCTTVGTGSALTPNALDPADAATVSTIVAKDTVTADPTLTAAAFLKGIPLNQRNTFRWVAVPGKELIIPATVNNGLLFGLSAASTTTMACDASFEEQ